MFVKKVIEDRFKKDGTLSKCKKIRYHYKCDKCNKFFDKEPKKCKGQHNTKSGLHFCSRKCRKEADRTGGKLRDYKEINSLKKYGTRFPGRLKQVKEKTKQTFQRRYGNDVTCPLHVPGAKEKRRKTHLERYGVEETFQSEFLKEKRRKTWMKRYGVSYKPFEQDKIKESMMKMPQKWSSKGEGELSTLLQNHFGEVLRQKWVNCWPIDIYIPSIDVYIQFDGVYWHGLDRPIEVIAESTRPRDKSIYIKWTTDRKQNQWFKEHNLTLIRVTDKEFKKN